MDNSPYAPPKTSSPHQKQPPYHPDKWSQRKLLLLTFTPSSISFLSALLMLVDEGFIQLAMLGTPLVAFLIAIATAINFAQTKAYSLTGQLIMWLLAHTALVILSFIGCTIIIVGIS